MLGLDSFKRTANCTLEVVDKNVTLDLHYGFGFYQQSFKSLKINGQDMSASYRIRNNSVHLSYTVHNIGQTGDRCFVILHDLSYERLAKIDFSSSRPEYDGIDLEEYFEKEIIPFLNSKINKRAVEKSLEGFVCKHPHLELSDHMPLLHQTILEQIVNWNSPSLAIKEVTNCIEKRWNHVQSNINIFILNYFVFKCHTVL